MNPGRTRLLKPLKLRPIALASLLVLSLFRICVSQTPADAVLMESFRQRMQLTTEELADLEKGDPVVRTLRAKDRREIAVYGIVRLPADTATIFKAFQQSMSQQKSDRAASGNPFSKPARLEDLQTLTLSHREIADLQRCSIGNCKVKLSAEMIDRFQNGIDWMQQDRELQATYLFRQMLVEYVQRYAEQGDPALIEYRDGSQAVKVADEYISLFPELSYLDESAPGLINYLSNYPHQELKAVKNEIVWAKVSFGLKPVVIVTHQTTYNPEPNRIFLISKQIYANHYFDSSLGLIAVVSGPKDAYLFYVNHSRAAALDGAFSGLKHRLIEREAVKSLSELLLATRVNLQFNPGAETVNPQAGPAILDWFWRHKIWWAAVGLLILTVLLALYRISLRKDPAQTHAKAPNLSVRNKMYPDI